MSWDSDWLDLQRRSLDLGHELGVQLLEHGNAYFEFIAALHDARHSDDPQSDETANAMAAMRSMLTAPVTATNRINGLWDRPLTHWQRIADQWLASVTDKDVNEERSELVRESQRLGHEYQQFLARYAQVHSDIAMRAVEQLQGALAKRDADAPLSGRAIFDIWIDCCEEQYARTVATEEYAKLQGQMINAALAMQRTQRCLAVGARQVLDGPSRGEFDALQQRLQDVEAELNRLRALSKPRAEGKRTRAGQRQQKK
ncbi:MAG: hypothetical protein OEQ39_27685 [Gammaproteobacteria bacterium]|nr:hypothetical protein [Gammaproteobacteria bacterium]MDH3464444.1 hypothetical protein [Gammaproteobacteria bacterium]